MFLSWPFSREKMTSGLSNKNVWSLSPKGQERRFCSGNNYFACMTTRTHLSYDHLIWDTWMPETLCEQFKFYKDTIRTISLH